MLDHFTKPAKKVILAAQQEARSLGHKYVGAEHILLGLIAEGRGLAEIVLKSAGIDLKVAREEAEKLTGRGGGCRGSKFKDFLYTPGANRVFQLSQEEARRQGHAYVKTIDLLFGLLKGGDDVVTRLIESQGAKVDKIRDQVVTHMASQDDEDRDSNNHHADSSCHHRVETSSCQKNPMPPLSLSRSNDQGAKNADKNHQTPMLDKFGTNLTKLAQEGKLHPFLGRQEQVQHMIQIFCRRTKNNPCLVGEPGVGKKSIIEGLAYRIVKGNVPDKLKGKKVMKLEVPHLLYGTSSEGTSEDRIKCLIKETEECGDVVLFINQVHTLFEAKSTWLRSSAYILQNALERGVIQCIGVTTLKQHRMHMENDASLDKIFQIVKVFEPSVEETVEILKGLRVTYETHHKLRYTDEALVAASVFSRQYISDGFLPDKAIDLIDEAGSHVQLCHAQAGKKHSSTPTVTKLDILHIVSSRTGIPLNEVSSEESDRLLKLEEILHKHVIGQKEAISTISRAIRRARVGLKNPRRPIASFMFTGSTGVGKTELAKALASQYFGSEDALIRLDMSEFMEKHTASKLTGAPPGYVGYDEGGQLTEAVKHRSHAVVLLDEIEKAHSDVFNVLLQILEDGRLTDGKGQTVDFNNTLIIMTSNVGSSIIYKEYSCGNEVAIEIEGCSGRVKKLVIEEIKQHFKPEFLNRIDEIIVFQQLTKQEVKQIADIMLREVCQRLKAKDITLSVTCRFRDHVVEHGYDPSYGARPLRRMISRLFEDTLAEKILTKEIKEGDSVIVDVNAEGNVVVLNHKNATKEDLSMSCVDSNGNVLVGGNKEKEAGVSCGYMRMMFDLLGNRKSP